MTYASTTLRKVAKKRLDLESLTVFFPPPYLFIVYIIEWLILFAGKQKKTIFLPGNINAGPHQRSHSNPDIIKQAICLQHKHNYSDGYGYCHLHYVNKQGTRIKSNYITNLISYCTSYSYMFSHLTAVSMATLSLIQFTASIFERLLSLSEIWNRSYLGWSCGCYIIRYLMNLFLDI